MGREQGQGVGQWCNSREEIGWKGEENGKQHRDN